MAESIDVIASADPGAAKDWITELRADGILAGDWPYGRHAAAPAVPAGFRALTVYRD